MSVVLLYCLTMTAKRLFPFGKYGQNSYLTAPRLLGGRRRRFYVGWMAAKKGVKGNWFPLHGVEQSSTALPQAYHCVSFT